jgi:hypothetical protein
VNTLTLLLASAGVLVLPGLVVGLVGGLRGWLLAAASPLVSYGIVGLTGPLLPAIGLSWSVYGLLGSTVVLALVVYALRLLLRRVAPGLTDRPGEDPGPAWSRWHHVAVGTTALGVTGFGVWSMDRASRGMVAIPQWWDAIFHQNAIRFIADTGDSAPSALRAIDRPGATQYFYPNTYHVMQATVMQADRWAVPQVINMANGLVIGVFAVGMMVLAMQFLRRPAFVVAIGLMSVAFTSFPYDTLVWGPIFPFTAGVAMIPGALALLARLLTRPTPGLLPVTALAMVGLLAAHPSVAIAAAVGGVALFAQRWITLRRIPGADLGLLGLLAVFAVLAGVFQLGGVLVATGQDAFTWPIQGPPASTLGGFLLVSHVTQVPAWWLVGLWLVGLVAVRRLLPMAWWIVTGLVFTALFVMDASYKNGLIAALTRPWWNDSWRLEALATTLLITLAASGLVVVYDVALALLGRLSRQRLAVGQALVRTGVFVLVLAVVGVLTHWLYFGRNSARLSDTFPNGPSVSDVEKAAMDKLKQLAPADSLVMNDPQDGSPLMWALDDVRPVYGHALIVGSDNAAALGAQRALLLTSFNKIDTDPAVRSAVHDLNIDYVYVGDGFITPESKRLPGLTNLDHLRSLKLVFQNSQARIYQVVDAGAVGPS